MFKNDFKFAWRSLARRELFFVINLAGLAFGIVFMLLIGLFIYFDWLQSFAYRIEIGWWMFALAGGMALIIALLTVGIRALKAALANPVESLRYE
jgi:putative ABC transport system permease protein